MSFRSSQISRQSSAQKIRSSKAHQSNALPKVNKLTDEQKQEINVLLGSSDVNIDDTDENGYSALFYSSIAGHLELVKYIIEKGAIITPNIFVATCYYGHVGVVKHFLLLSQNTLINKLTKKGKCGLSMAVRGGHVEMIKLLAETPGVDLALTDSDGKYPLEYLNVEQTSNDYRQILAEIILQKIQTTPLLDEDRNRYIDSLHRYIIAVGNNNITKNIMERLKDL
jgi:hypothetical protein